MHATPRFSDFPSNSVTEFTVQSAVYLSTLWSSPYLCFHIWFWRYEAKYIIHLQPKAFLPWLQIWKCSGRQTVRLYQVSCFYEKLNDSPQIQHISPGRRQHLAVMMTHTDSLKTVSVNAAVARRLHIYVTATGVISFHWLTGGGNVKSNTVMHQQKSMKKKTIWTLTEVY